MMWNVIKRRIGFFLILILAALSAGTAAADSGIAPAGFTRVAETDTLILYAKTDDGQIALENKKNGTLWYSNPQDRDEDKVAKGVEKMNLGSQLLITYSDNNKLLFRCNSLAASVRRDALKSAKIKDGIRFVYDFPRKNEQFTVPVEYTLKGDYLSAKVLTGEIKEYGTQSILSISLLPYFGAGGMKDTGYLFVPDGSGGLIHFNNGKISYNDFEAEVYGRNPVLSTLFKTGVKQQVLLPVIGARKGNQAFITIMEQGSGKINASVSGKTNSYNNVMFTFDFRESDTAVLAEANFNAKDVLLVSRDGCRKIPFEMRIYPLGEESPDYSGMASRYRRFLEQEKGLVKRVKGEHLPFYLELWGGVKREKAILGLPFQVLEPLTTFSEAEKILGSIGKSGVSSVILDYKGWMQGGPNETVPVNPAPERKLGGKRGFEHLKQYAKEHGVQLYPDVEFLNIQRGSFGYSRFRIPARGVSKAPAMQYAYRMSTYYKNPHIQPWYLLSLNLLEEVTGKFSGNFGRLDTEAAAVGSLGNTLYSDHGNGKSIFRAEAKQLMQEAAERLNRSVGNLLVESPNDYLLKYSGAIKDLPVFSSRYLIEDEEIPFLQMVLHGVVDYSTPPVNLSSDSRVLFLKAMETGSSISYVWIARDPSALKDTRFNYLYGTGWEKWVKEAVASHRELDGVLSKVRGSRIVSHARLSDGVVETTYENGIKIVVNYNNSPAAIPGGTVAGLGYRVMEGGM